MNPIIPNNIDLRSFEFMPLDVVRFRDSDFAALVSAEAFRAGFMLMCASWHQVPAGSLPNDDRILSNLAGFGRVVKEWKKYKDEALHGWVLCDDGRYYHPVVCEKAIESWNSKQEYNYKKFTERLRKANLKLGEQEQIVIPNFDLWINAGMPESWDKNSKVVELECKSNSASIPQEFRIHSAGIPEENAHKGTEHNGQGEVRDINNTLTHTNTGEENSLDEILNLWNPDLHSVNSWLQQSGEKPMTQKQFDEFKPAFLNHYASQIQTGLLKPDKLFGKMVAWVKRDYKSRDAPKPKSPPPVNNRNVNDAWGEIPEPQPDFVDDMSDIPEGFV